MSAADSPIVFTCSCGKQLKAERRFAGRKARCIRCDQLVTVPIQLPGDDLADFERLLGEEPDAIPAEVPEPRPAASPAAFESPRPSPRPAAQESPLPPSRSYPAMELIARICRVLAAIAAVLAALAIIGGVVFAVATKDPAFAIAVVPMGLLGLLFALLLVMTAESIKLGIDIQANTLAAAHAARRAG